MSLTAADIEQILKLLESSSFDELTLEQNGLKVVLRRGAGAASTAPAAANVTTPPPVAVARTIAPLPTDEGGQAVTSPMLGTFYRAPKPGAPPFIAVGTAVEVDTVIGIVEVMKLMNTVRAGVRGRVTAILASDGALVEFGETLLRVAPTD